MFRPFSDLSIMLFMAGLFVAPGCKQQAPLERSSFKGRQPQTADQTVKDDTDNEEETPKKKKKKKVVEDEDTDKKEKEEEEDAKIEYPQLAFNGNGYTTYKLKDKLTMRMGIETQLDDDSLIIDTKTAKVECGGKSGCDQREVDASVNAKSIGANVYKRSSKDELKKLKEDGFNSAYYAIFTKSVRGKNGYTFTFEKPLPVYPWPAARSRYEELESGSATWTAKVTSDRYIPLNPNISQEVVEKNGELYVQTGNAKKEFTATITVSLQSVSSTQVKLTFEVNIPDDKKRMLYKYFPVPRSSAFTIDTEKKDVREVHMINWSNGDKSREEEESVVDYMLCTKTTASGVKQYSCD